MGSLAALRSAARLLATRFMRAHSIYYTSDVRFMIHAQVMVSKYDGFATDRSSGNFFRLARQPKVEARMLIFWALFSSYQNLPSLANVSVPRTFARMDMFLAVFLLIQWPKSAVTHSSWVPLCQNRLLHFSHNFESLTRIRSPGQHFLLNVSMPAADSAGLFLESPFVDILSFVPSVSRRFSTVIIAC